MSTITIPDPLPSPEEDSEKLMKAFQGWGTDEKAVIEVLGHRSAAQRRAIAAAYHRIYNEPLVQRLRSELSGDFSRAMILWVEDPAERDAKLVNQALKKGGDRNTWVIIEIACASRPDHLVAVRKAYCSLFNASLEEDVASHFASHKTLRQLLVRLVSSYRYEGEMVDEQLAHSEAAVLYKLVENKKLHDEEVIRILSTRNKSQLKSTFQDYRQTFGKALDEDVESSDISDGKLKLVLIAVIWCIEAPEKHFAQVIKTSVQGLGTDEDSLTRAIVTRADHDMKRIKEEYKNRYKTTLKADVVDDTSGHYKDLLLTLMGSAWE